MLKFIKKLITSSKAESRKTNGLRRRVRGNEDLKHSKMLSGSKYDVASCQSVGKERAHNEDTLFVLNTYLDGLDSQISFGLFLVADGMGGHQSGEIASGLAAQTVSQYLINQVLPDVMFNQKIKADQNFETFVKDAVQNAQSTICQRVPGGGTTLTLAMIVGNLAFFAHVGDSRLYQLTADGKFIQKSRDHSLVNRLIELGEITPSDAITHPQRNVLYRALGQSDALEIDYEQFNIQHGERLLICSDGLSGVLPEEQLIAAMKSDGPLGRISCELVQAANDAGGPDNISVIVIERIQ